MESLPSLPSKLSPTLSSSDGSDRSLAGQLAGLCDGRRERNPSEQSGLGIRDPSLSLSLYPLLLLASKAVGLSLWVVILVGVGCQIPYGSDVYILIHNSSKVSYEVATKGIVFLGVTAVRNCIKGSQCQAG